LTSIDGFLCLRKVGLTTLETRRLRADMVEVYKMLIEGTDEVKKSKEGWNVEECIIGNCIKSVLI